jgi:hypothetical protein
VLTIITPTCDQPTGIRLCEHFMQRQTIWGAVPIQWIVVDDGMEPAKLTMGQTHVTRQREADCAPAQSLCRNLLAAIPLIDGEIVAFVEHDDWYRPDHLEGMCKQLGRSALLAGDDRQRYYNIAHRCWRIFQNKGASLCQTAMKASLLPRFERVVRECLASSRFYIDFKLWMATPQTETSTVRTDSVLGIKGLPGRPGLGIGHRPTGLEWNRDPGLSQLRAWIGADTSLYESIAFE